MMIKNELKELIYQEFKDNIYTSRDDLEADTIYSEVEFLFDYREWQSIPDDILEEDCSATSFLSHKGFKFYFPRYMMYFLDNYLKRDSDICDRVLSLLDPLYYLKGGHYSSEQLGLCEFIVGKLKRSYKSINFNRLLHYAELNDGQRHVILDFLCYLKDDLLDEYDRTSTMFMNAFNFWNDFIHVNFAEFDSLHNDDGPMGFRSRKSS